MKASASILALLFVLGLLVGGLGIYYISYQQVSVVNQKISNLQNQFSNATGFQNATYQTINILQNGTSLSDLYVTSKNRSFYFKAKTSTGTVQGSGFIYDFKAETLC